MGGTTSARVLEVLRRMDGAALLALSGGLDSRVLAKVAWDAGLDVTAVHLRGPHVPAHESDAAIAWARAQGREPLVLRVNPLEHPAVAHNARDRCYHCKTLLFTAIRAEADRRGIAQVLDGTQADDLRGYRPGLRAIRELGVVSPLADAGLTKADVRALAREIGLSDPDQPSRPCLLTRLEYGCGVSAEVLTRLAAAEAELADLGLSDFRIRLHADGRVVLQLAATATPPPADHMVNVLTRHGFGQARILATPTVSGYFDN